MPARRRKTTARSRPPAKRTVGRKAVKTGAKMMRSSGRRFANRRGMANSASTPWNRGGYAREEYGSGVAQFDGRASPRKLASKSRATLPSVANEYTRAARRETRARQQANAARRRKAKTRRKAKSRR